MKPDIAVISPKSLDNVLKRQLYSAVGMEYFQNRDPVYHISESFQRAFETRAAPQANTGEDSPVSENGVHSSFSSEATGTASKMGETGVNTGNAGAFEAFRAKTSMDGMFEPAPARRGDTEDGQFMMRFSETAFNRGKLAGAVMRGSGQMMLFSCLKRTIGQSQPKNFRQRKLFESGTSVKREMVGQQQAQVIFNRGAVDGAVAVVVDATRGARRVLEAMTELAEGSNILKEGSGAETLQKIYPFLLDTKECELLERYQRLLDDMPQTLPDYSIRRNIILRAIARTHAVIERKRQTRQLFMRRLSEFSDNALAASRMFESPEFLEELTSKLTEWAPDNPEDEGGEDGSGGQGGDNGDNPENGGDK